MRRNFGPIFLWSVFLTVVFTGSCQRSNPSDGFDVLGPTDETGAAGEVIKEANKDLMEIKMLYKNNEGKREELKKALETDDAAAVKRISNEVIDLIDEGTGYGENAARKIRQAQDMEINEDYRDYLKLKEEALKRQFDAFANYKLAAESLRANYDPKNTQLRDKVKEEFKQRSENYRTIMEEAREYSTRANELRKDVITKEREQ
ncbi:MAG: hypothetical protein WBD22_04320 [Pyrinomonadaceae bacterium]